MASQARDAAEAAETARAEVAGAPFAASLETQHAAEQFLYHQAEILDDRRWDDWMALFTQDGTYWMPADPTDQDPDGIPSIFHEDRYLMLTRIRRLRHPRAWSQSPRNRTSHVVSNVIVESEDAATGDLVVRAKFHVVEYRLDATRYFAGSYRHELKATPAGLKIRRQRVDIVNVEGPFDYVLQYWI